MRLPIKPLTFLSQEIFYPFLREKAKWKDREEAWLKIENLAKSNPQVTAHPGGFKTSEYGINLRILRYSFIQFFLFKQLTELLFPLCLVSDAPGLCKSRQTSGHGDGRPTARRFQHAEENRTGRSHRGQEVIRAQDCLCLSSVTSGFESLLSSRSRKSSVENAR